MLPTLEDLVDAKTTQEDGESAVSGVVRGGVEDAVLLVHAHEEDDN